MAVTTALSHGALGTGIAPTTGGSMEWMSACVEGGSGGLVIMPSGGWTASLMTTGGASNVPDSSWTDLENV